MIYCLLFSQRKHLYTFGPVFCACQQALPLKTFYHFPKTNQDNINLKNNVLDK